MKYPVLLKALFAIVILPCMVVSMHSCQKSKTATNTSQITTDTAHVDSITYSGCDYVGEIIIFSYSIVGKGSIAIKNLSWDFGEAQHQVLS